jgi:hypothetical protein
VIGIKARIAHTVMRVVCNGTLLRRNGALRCIFDAWTLCVGVNEVFAFLPICLDLDI